MALRSPIGRVSFPAVFTPVDPFNTGKPMFEISLLFKKSEEQLKDMRAAVQKAGVEKFGKLPFKSPIKDGDELLAEKQAMGKEGYDAYEGMWVVSFRSKNRPKVVDKNRLEIEDDGTFYAGCYGCVSYTPSTYKVTDRGVNLYLGNVQMVKDGEPFVSRSTPEEDFDVIAVEDDDDFLN